MHVSKDRLKRLFVTLWNCGYTHNFNTARLLAKQAVMLPDFEFNASDRSVTSNTLRAKIGVETHFQFLPELKNLEELVERRGATIEPVVDGKLLITIDGVRVVASGPEQVAILRELFVHGIYNVVLPAKAVVIDIGMNVGIASLYFASNPNVERVYAFEPFEETYEYGIRNFSLNPKLASKIEPNQFAVSDRDGELDVEYSSQWRNSNSVYGVQTELRGSGTRVEKIALKKASSVVRGVIETHPSSPIVMKVDCEGSEYAIFEELDRAGLFKKINVVMLEWHGKGPEQLETTLARAGFATFSFDPKHPNVGMAYAARLG